MNIESLMIGAILIIGGTLAGTAAAAQAGLDIPNDAITLGLIGGGLALIEEGLK